MKTAAQRRRNRRKKSQKNIVPSKSTSPRSTPQLTSQSGQSQAQAGAKKSRWSIWAKPRLKLLSEVLGLVGFAIAVYVLRPILSTSSLPPLIGFAPSSGRFLVVNNGQLPIRNVQVECRGNKAVFAGQYTLALNGYISTSEYSVPEVGAGESFVADCQQPWALHMNQRDGFFSYGDMRKEYPPPVIYFTLSDGRVVLSHPNGRPQKGWFDVSLYREYPITGIDASLIITYRLPIIGLQRSKKIHLVAEQRGGNLGWTVAPESEAILPDGNGGFRVTSSGFGVRIGPRHR